MKTQAGRTQGRIMGTMLPPAVDPQHDCPRRSWAAHPKPVKAPAASSALGEAVLTRFPELLRPPVPQVGIPGLRSLQTPHGPVTFPT